MVEVWNEPSGGGHFDRDLKDRGVALDVIQARQVGPEIAAGIFLGEGGTAAVDQIAAGDGVTHPDPGAVRLHVEGGQKVLQPTSADLTTLVTSDGVLPDGGQLLDVVGESREDGARIGLYKPTNGPNQRWQAIAG